MFNYTLPLLLEEQAALLLWEKVQPHVKDSIGSHDEVQKAIHAYMHSMADHVRQEELDKRQEEIEAESNDRPN